MQKTVRAVPPTTRIAWTNELRWSLAGAVMLAVAFWLFALAMRERELFMVWDDQSVIFLRGADYLSHPFDSPGFYNPPWAFVILFPFNVLRETSGLAPAILTQLILYFVILTLIVYKFGGDWRSLLIVFTSPFAFESALELNIDWIVALGLLVPPIWSGIFLAVKPQAAFGYVTSFTPGQFIRMAGISAVMMLLSFLLWGNWLWDFYVSTKIYKFVGTIDVAPINVFTPFVTVPIALFFFYRAIRRKDGLYGVLGGVMVTPYLAGYSVLVPLTLVAARWKGLALGFSLCIWLIVFLAL